MGSLWKKESSYDIEKERIKEIIALEEEEMIVTSHQ